MACRIWPTWSCPPVRGGPLATASPASWPVAVLFGSEAAAPRLALGPLAMATTVTATMTTKRPVTQTLAIRKSFMARWARLPSTARPLTAAAC